MKVEYNGKILHWSPEAYEKILGDYDYKKIIWKDAQKMRDNGMSTREIARQLKVSQPTVLRHTKTLANTIF